MKSKSILVGISLVVLVGLASCGRFSGNTGSNNNPPGQTQTTSVQNQPALITPTTQGLTGENNPAASQTPIPTLKPAGLVATPTVVVTLPANVELKQTLNDLSDNINNLSKDLDSTDTLDDVK